MERQDPIKDIFREKLEGFEAEVRPDLWNSLSSKVTSTTVTSSVSTFSLISKVVVGLTLLGVVFVSTHFLMKDNEPLVNNLKEVKPSNKALFEKEVSLKTQKEEKRRNADKRTSSKPEAISIENKQSFVLEEEVHVALTIADGTPTTFPNNEAEPLIVLGDNQVISAVSSQSKKQTEIQTPESAIEVETTTAKIETLPNIFTPNSDGANDFLQIISADLKEFSVVVLDGNNRIVFSSQDPNFKWDGRLMNGDEAPAGNYIYYVTAKDSLGNPVTRSSGLMIRR